MDPKLVLDYSSAGVEATIADRAVPAEFLPLAGSISMDVFATFPRATRFSLEVLDELYAEGILEDGSGKYILPWSALEQLEDQDRLILGLAPAQHLPVTVNSEGYIGGDLKLSARVIHPRWGQLEGRYPRHSCAYILPGEVVLVNTATATLLDSLATPSSERAEDQLAMVGHVKKLAAACGASLDAYLNAEQVFEPEQFQLDINVTDPAHLSLAPSFTSEIPSAANSALKDMRKGLKILSAGDGQSRVRVHLKPALQSGLATLQGLGEVSGSNVPLLLTAPEQLFGPDFDLGLFSPRVKGILPRIRNARARLSFKPSGRDWFTVGVDVVAEDVPIADELGGAPAQAATDAARPATGAKDNEQAPTAGTTEPEAIDLDELSRLADESTEGFVQMPDKSWMQIDRNQLAQAKEARQQIQKEFPNGVPREKLGYILDVMSNFDELEFVGEPDELLQSATTARVELPQLRGTLHQYQIDGFHWLWHRATSHHSGAMLADEMGLGKTVQAISVLAKIFEDPQAGPALVVLPGSLLEKWAVEITKFCPAIGPAYIHHGQSRTRSRDLLECQKVVLTTYETLREDQLLFGQINWEMLICDESQKVKNPGAGVTRAVKGMKARRRLALTGTPVENNLEELWSQYDLLLPGFLHSCAEFRVKWARPIEDPAVPEEQKQFAAADLRATLTPYYLRRLKSEQLPGLPTIEEHRQEVQFGHEQGARYQQMVERARTGTLGQRMARLGDMIQICSHPLALTDAWAERSASELVGMCPKLQATFEYLRKVKELGERALIFTRYKRIQRILHTVVTELLGSPSFPVLNGEVPFGHRSRAVDQFNAYPGFGVLVLSPEATGVGLDLVGANHVIHYTRLWNPAKEAQATGRTHRIGQVRNVHVFYPIVVGTGYDTAEQHLDMLLADKRAIAEDVIWPTSRMNVEMDLLDAVLSEPAQTAG